MSIRRKNTFLKVKTSRHETMKKRIWKVIKNKTIVINNKKTNKRTKVISKKETTQKPEADPYQIRYFQIHRTPHMNRTSHYYSSNNGSLKKGIKKEKGMY